MPNGCTNLLIVGEVAELAKLLQKVSKLSFEFDAIISLGNVVDPGKKSLVPIYSWSDVQPDKVIEILGVKVLFSESAKSEIDSPVDILISKGINQDIALVGDKLTPWYHFVSGPYYESEPFFSKGRGTRLVSLANVDSSEKWAHLVRIGPTITPSRPVSGVNIYNTKSSHKADMIWGQPEMGRSAHEHESNKTNERASKKPKRACYMCLDSPTATQELVVATGKSVYLCTARGPIKSGLAYEKLECTGHVLLIPRSHIPSIARNGQADEQLELRKFEIALASMYRQYDLEPVTYEFVRDSTVHGHTQVVPVPASLVDKALQQMKSAFVNRSMATSSQPLAGDYLAVRVSDRPCIYVQLPARNVDLQLPRAILCQVLGLAEGAADWKQCLLEDEAQDAKQMQTIFKPFNFLE